MRLQDVKPLAKVRHEFVESFPDDLEDGMVYVSVVYASAAHKCCCGCGEKVITPISPKGWTLTFNGEVISLYPSIGNWNFVCQSHYWIKENSVVWVDDDDVPATIQSVGAADSAGPVPPSRGGTPARTKPKESFWQKVKKWRW